MDAFILLAELAGINLVAGAWFMLCGGILLGASMVVTGKQRKERMKMAVLCLIAGICFLTLGSLLKFGIIEDDPPKNPVPVVPQN